MQDEASLRMPKGIAFLVGNEATERYTYYAMRTILAVYMTTMLLNGQGQLAPMSDAEATEVFHLFAATNYFFPILGSILADLLIGKYLTVISLSVVYTVGCTVLAMDQTRLGLYLGLGLIALGSGGIKPCMMAMLGDQFKKVCAKNPAKQKMLDAKLSEMLGRATRYFYMGIQVGGLISTLLSPIVLEYYGPKVAFGIPAVLMGLATLIFWWGRKVYVKVPPNAKAFKEEVLTKEGLAVVIKLGGLLLFMAAFFSLYDQNGSSWVLQAKKMDLHFMGIEWLESQIQAVNPVLCIVVTFLFTKWVYPFVEKRIINPTPLRRMGFGLFLMIVTFLITAWIQWRLDAGETLNIAWQLLAWVVLSTAEVLAYSTALEFFYTQAPPRMKSLVQGMFLLSVTLGNLFTAGVNWGIENVAVLKSLTGAAYFVFFAAFMAIMTVAFVAAAVLYEEKTYLQDGTTA